MTSCPTLCIWAVVATASLLLCTQATAHTSSGHSKFEVPNQGRYRPAHRGAPTEDEGNSFYYDLTDGKGRDLQRFEPRGGDDLALKSWPGGEALQSYGGEDPGQDRFKESHGSIYDDEDEDDMIENELEANLEEDPQKNKRESHSLSIVNPLDVLRQRLMLDLATRKMKQNQEQIKANDVILKNLGKRSLREGKHQERTGLTPKQGYLSRHQV